MRREDRTRRYETMVVLRADLLDAGVKEQIERNRRLLEANGAEIAGVHEWGLRELAYPIEKERRGYYVLFEYLAEAPAVSELERHLKLSDVTLRFVSVRQERDAPLAVPPARDEDVPIEAREALATEEDDGTEGDVADLEERE